MAFNSYCTCNTSHISCITDGPCTVGLECFTVLGKHHSVHDYEYQSINWFLKAWDILANGLQFAKLFSAKLCYSPDSPNFLPPKFFTVQYVRTCVVLRKVVTYIILYACMFTCVDTFIYIIIHIHVSCVVVLQVGQLLEQTGVYDQP